MGLCTSCDVDTNSSHHKSCGNNNNNPYHTIFSNGCQPYYTTHTINPKSTFKEYNEQSDYVTLPSYYTNPPPPYNPNS